LRSPVVISAAPGPRGKEPRRAPGYPPEFHTWAFGEWGLAFYLIRERRDTVLLLDVLWAGP
jgi:hypothetical protein